MPSRAMIVVGGGSSTRFGTDKLLTEVAGRPLIAHTVSMLSPQVDRCIVVCRSEMRETIEKIAPDVTVATGGPTRTLSEMAGLAALGGAEHDLIGIHDAARPVVDPDLVERLFSVAAQVGGAVPVIAPDRLFLDRRAHRPVPGVVRAQTPQVFRGPELMAAYVTAAQVGFEGHDTVEVVLRFSELIVVGIPGDEANVKVTFPEDIELVSRTLEDPSRTGPR